MELELPHKTPILFAKKIVSRGVNRARVYVEFDKVPSLAMLVESAAQSASAIDENFSVSNAYLVSMKNIKLLTSPSKNHFEVEVINEHNLENMKLINFTVFEDKELISTGSLTIATSKEAL